MKTRIHIVLEDGILRLAKQRAAKEGRALDTLIQDALAQYLAKEPARAKARRAAYQLFCGQPMKIPPDQLRYVIEEDLWNP